jgi:hypothetical protein
MIPALADALIQASGGSDKNLTAMSLAPVLSAPQIAVLYEYEASIRKHTAARNTKADREIGWRQCEVRRERCGSLGDIFGLRVDLVELREEFFRPRPWRVIRSLASVLQTWGNSSVRAESSEQSC